MKKKTRLEVEKEINEKHNTSWIIELLRRNADRMDDIAIKYRGETVTYGEMFKKMEEYAKALKVNGVEFGDRFTICIPNTPEYVYFIGAASILGAKIDIISEEFASDYLQQKISKGTCGKVFMSDKCISEMKDVLIKCDKDVVLVPFEHSLKNGNPYKDITEKYYKLDEEQVKQDIKYIEENSKKVINIDEFLSDSKKFTGTRDELYSKHSMEEPFTITYSSGSTNSARPKAIVHNAKSYIYMGRYHDQDVSAYPTMKGATTLAYIPTHSNTNLSNSISDTLMEGGKIAFEPIYNEEYFLDALMINEPTLALGTRSHWLVAMKKYYNENKNYKMPFMLVPASVGEPLAANEEKALNKWLKKIRAGINIIPSPNSFVSMSVGGGDCEHGGIFFILFRSLYSKLPRKNFAKEPIGMSVYNMVDIAALRPDKTICKPYEMGELVCVSPCNMMYYEDNEEANKEFYITDANGKVWTRLNTHGYLDSTNHVYVKGRILDNSKELPEFVIADVILRDTKKILSCEVVKLEENNELTYVAHVEPMINTSINKETVLASIKARCINTFGEELANKICVRWHTNKEGYQLTGCGKRSYKALKAEGLEKIVDAEENQKGIARTLKR